MAACAIGLAATARADGSWIRFVFRQASGLQLGELAVYDHEGTRLNLSPTNKGVGVVWETSAESFANVVVQPTTLYYHPLLKLRQARQPRYIRITGLDQWNIGEIEFRLLRRTGGTLVVR